MFYLLAFNVSDSLLNLNFQDSQINSSPKLVHEKIVYDNHNKFEHVQYKFKNSTRTNYTIDSSGFRQKSLISSPSPQDFAKQSQQSQEKAPKNLPNTFNTQTSNLPINSSDRAIIFDNYESQAIFLSQTEQELNQENETNTLTILF